MEDPASETLKFRTLTNPKKRSSKGRSFYLIVMEGPDKGASFALGTGICSLGRAKECDIVLHGQGISRHHANVLVKAHGDVIVEDLDSTNGVYLDGERVTKKLVEPGQTLALGPEVKIRLELSSHCVQNLLREMYESATLDSLTGLLTRRGFEERLDVEFAMVHRYRTPACLAVIDLDHFKAVNDREGHEAGDVVLKVLAQAMKDNVRIGDLACRWGGEEFTVYLRQTPLIGAVVMLERLRVELEETEILLPAGHKTRVTFSAGVVDLLDFEDWRSAFRHADEALYQAKREGRNRVVPRSQEEP